MAHISPGRLRALRIHAQHLAVKASRDDMAEVVRSLCGVNAQSEPAMMLSLRARVEGLKAADVVQAIEQKRLVRAWAMRGTLHLLDRDDLGWMVSLLGPPIVARGRRRRLELGLTDDILAKSLGEIPAVLNDGPLTRGELADRLAGRGIEIDRTGQAPYHLIAYAALKGLLFMGPDSRDGDHTYSLVEGIVKERAQYSGEEALAGLIRRYLWGYGPAALEDFAAWSGLSMADARKGRELNTEALAELEVSGRSLWSPVTSLRPPAVPASAETVVNLLPAFDAYVLGYSRREHIVRPEHQDKLYQGGQTVPVVLVNGLAEGLWRYERRGKKLNVRVSMFRPPGRAVKKLIKEEVENVGLFMGLPVAHV